MYTRNGWLPEVFNDFFENDNMVPTRATAPAINVLESNEAYTVELAAPGMKKEDFNISLNQDGDLNIKMEARHKPSSCPRMLTARKSALMLPTAF
jgi:HSP20 family protein